MKFHFLQYFKAITVCIFALFFSVHTLQAQLSKKYTTYEESYFQGMRYGLFTPENYDSKKSYPLVVYLHGSRDTVSRDMVWYQASIQKENPCFVLSPKSEEHNLGWGDTWHDTHPEAAKKTLSLLDDLIKKYNIDTNRLYIFGISMGGFGVFSFLSKEPEKFAAAYAVCGGSDIKAANKLLKTPLWIFHGDKDDVVPVTLSRNVYNEIVRLGGKKVRYTEYPGVKHNSWEDVSREKSLSRWLLLQKKGKNLQSPDCVSTLSAEPQEGGIKLTWDRPSGIKTESNEIWFYKLFRDNVLIKEIEGSENKYSDLATKKEATYYMVAVNYLFKESDPCFSVKIK